MARGTRDWGLVSSGLQNVAELPTYAIPVIADIAASASGYVLSLFMPANANARARARRILITIAWDFDVADGEITFQLFRTTALGTGDAITPTPMDPSDDAAQLQAIENLTVDPTITVGHSALWYTRKDNNTVQLARTSEQNQQGVLYEHLPGAAVKPMTLNPGEGVAVFVASTGVGATISVNVEHTEDLG